MSLSMSVVKNASAGFTFSAMSAGPVRLAQHVRGRPLPVRTVITKMDMVVHPVIRRAKPVRGREITTARLVIQGLICPAVNVLTALTMRYVTDRLIFPAIRATANQATNVSERLVIPANTSPAVNVLTALPMRYVTDRLIFPAIRAISNQTAPASKKNKNRQRRTRSTLVRRA